MEERFLLELSLIFVLGFAARWVAWRLNLPSILLLLICGLAAGPWLGWLHPDDLLGNALLPFVSISVALILFEGGLSLNVRELKGIGGVVRNLVTVGALVTWVFASFGAWLILELSAELAILMGAIFVVTGPTVVLPLLRHVRPTTRIRNTIKWEGILNDPVGAILAVLVFEAIVTGGGENPGGAFLYAVLTGTGVGLMGGALIVIALRFHWIPEILDNAFSLAMVVAAFTVSNHYYAESGLIATTVMGIALANQRFTAVKHIVEFKENLRVLILSTLFILLAARLDAESLASVWAPSLGYLVFLVLLVRPATVWVSCLGSQLTKQERIFLGWMAPRGIVAAAVSSIFATRLVELGYSEAEKLVPISFLLIIGSVTVYGLTASPVARKLGLSEPSPEGILLVGAHGWARQIAKVLNDLGVAAALADSRWKNVSAARLEGLSAYFGAVLSKDVLDSVNLHGIGRLAAVTSNEEANALAAVHFAEVFGRKNVYQLHSAAGDARKSIHLSHLSGRNLFGEEVTFDELDEKYGRGWLVKATTLTDKFTYADFQERNGGNAIPLFIVAAGDPARLTVVETSGVKPRSGQTVVAMCPPE